MVSSIRNLIQAARTAQAGAYAPYSHFAVGAAVLSRDGRIFSGANVENASYGLTICAERNALFQMVAAGEREFQALAVVADTTSPVRPCGACLQVMCEFAGPGSRVIMAGRDNRAEDRSLAELMPLAFIPEKEERKP